MSEKDKLIFHKADTVRQFEEREALADKRLKETAAFRAGNKVLDLLLSLKCDASAIVSQLVALENSQKGFNGKVTYVIGTVHDGGAKAVEIPVHFKEGVEQIPDGVVVQALLGQIEGAERKVEASIRKEIEDLQKPRPQVDLKKTASAVNSPAGGTLAQVLKVDKTWFPTDLKVGDLLYVDGGKYRVASGDEGKLNAESDGSHWTLSLVTETVDAKESITKIIY